MTTTPVARVGPAFVAVTVNVTVLPTSGAALSTVLVTAMSAAGGAVHHRRRRVVARLGIGLVLAR